MPFLFSKRRVIIVGAGWAGKTTVKILRDFASSHVDIIGFVDDDSAKQQQLIQGVPVLGSTHQLRDIARQKQATEIVLALNHTIQGRALAGVMECYEQGVRVSTMSDLYEDLTHRVPVEHISDNWFVALPLHNKGQNLS